MDIQSYLLGKKAGGGGSGDLDWTAIGYEQRPQSINDGYTYAKQIYDNWDATQTTLNNKFLNDYNLVYMPLVDTSNVTTMSSTFSSCYCLQEVGDLDTSSVTTFTGTFMNCRGLKNIPVFDMGKVTTMWTIFSYCYSLTDESLDNILQSLISATKFTGTKTLNQMGFNTLTDVYPATKIQSLPHYQDFIDAGWTIGY